LHKSGLWSMEQAHRVRNYAFAWYRFEPPLQREARNNLTAAQEKGEVDVKRGKGGWMEVTVAGSADRRSKAYLF